MSLNKLKCFFKGHEWTCKHDEGIPPPKINGLKDGLMVAFFEYATSYCKRCGYVNPHSTEAVNAARTERASRASSAE